MNTMQKIPIKRVPSTLKAFTLLESILTLFIVSFLVISLSGSVQSVFRGVEEKIFFLEFEHLYRSSQKLAISSQQVVTLEIQEDGISNGYQTLQLPDTITVLQEQKLAFDQAGGNSSLGKVQFQTEEKKIAYQLYLGSGRYKKTEE